MADLFDGRLEEFGVGEHHSKKTSAYDRVLTDGRNYLLVFFVSNEEELNALPKPIHPINLGVTFTRRGKGNVVYRMLQAIREAFDVEIVSEHDHRFSRASKKLKREWTPSGLRRTRNTTSGRCRPRRATALVGVAWNEDYLAVVDAC